MRLRNQPLRVAGSLSGLALLGVACAVVVAGCGGSSTPATSTTSTASTITTSPTGTSTSATSSFAAYQACLKSHGVSFPAGGGFYRRTTTTGTSTTGGVTTPTTTTPALSSAQQQAIAACASLRPTGGFAGGGAFNSSNPAYAKFEACLKSHGVQTGTTASRTSTTAQAAFAACRSLLPNGGTFAPGSGASGAANSATFAKYQACLKSHGVQTGAAGQSPSKLEAAMAACRSILATSGGATTATTTTATTTPTTSDG